MQKNYNENTCIACQEAVTNPICQECLEKEIEFWLKRHKPRLISELRRKTREFIVMTDYSSNINCIFCKKNFNACAYCYTEFIQEWLAKKTPSLIPNFRTFFNFS